MASATTPSSAARLESGALYLPSVDLFVDPRGPAPRAGARAFVSHVHVLATWPKERAPGCTILASADTLALAAALGHDVSGATPLAWSTAIALAGSPIEAGVSVEPAGHVLGGAQLVVETARGKVVYAGDYAHRPGLVHAAGKAVACDELLVPCAYGLPIFRFPDRGETLEKIVRFCEQCLADKRTPALLAPPLGTAQELVRALTLRGLGVAADDNVYAATLAYVRLGVDVGATTAEAAVVRHSPKADPHTRVVVAGPSAHKEIRKMRSASVALVSGRAILDAAVEQSRADAAFVLSDLADFDELVGLVRRAGASSVTTVHGYARPFAEALAAAGVRATALEGASLDARHAREAS